MGQEFHIRRTELDENGYRAEFDIPAKSYWKIMGPNNLEYKVQEDQMGIEIQETGGKIDYSWEMGFIHIIFEKGKFEDQLAEDIVKEILANIIQETGQMGEYLQTY